VNDASFDGNTYGAPTTAILITKSNEMIVEQYREDYTHYTS
jgi:hypothetical protein